MTPLYQKVSDRILEKVRDGDLRVGDKLPPEAEYASELGVSRSTLRLAFTELERIGVLLRRRRAGTQIISDRPKTRFNMNTTGIRDVLSIGRDTELSDMRTRTIATADIPLLEDCHSETGHWLEVWGTRTLPSECMPFAVSRLYVPARYAGVEPLLMTAVPSVYRVIEQTFDVAVGRVSQTAKAVACPEPEAAVMGLAAGAPVMRVDARLYVRDGSLMEVSVAYFDGARFQLRTDVEID